MSPKLFVAVTHIVNSKARTGVQTVVRGLIHGLRNSDMSLRLVRSRKWRDPFCSITAEHYQRLEWDTPNEPYSRRDLAGAWLVVPEVIYNPRDHKMIRRAQRLGMRVAAIFHDAIPVYQPGLVRREAARHHADYLKLLATTDLLVAVSNTAAEQFQRFARENALAAPPLRVCSLAAEMIGVPRPDLTIPANELVTVVCVSTLDPRKNHKTLIDAFNIVCASRPDLNIGLDLIGAPYKDASHVVRDVQQAARANPRIKWHGSVSVEALAEFYRQSDFTVYPSILEGFGLPILESLWYRRPCVCANFGAMAEAAAGGGCLTTDVRDPQALAQSIVAVASDRALRARLTTEIQHRHLKTWAEYGLEFRRLLEYSAAVQPPANPA